MNKHELLNNCKCIIIIGNNNNMQIKLVKNEPRLINNVNIFGKTLL